jgi:hypothetical protein
MKTICKLLPLLALVFLSVAVYAQADTDVAIKPKSYFKLGITYLNNNVYLGRADTITTPSIMPKLSYTFKSGLYLSGGLDYVTNRSTKPLDGGNLEIGYTHSFTDKLEGGVSFTKLFYNSGSTQISSAISSILNAYVDYDIAGIITPALSMSYSIGKTGGTGGDISLNPNISHDFAAEGILGDNDLLIISPTAGLNAGTQNFYAGYLQRKGRLTKKGGAVQNAVYDNYIDALGAFRLLDYELSVPIEYKAGSFIFSFVPIMAFAQDSLPKSTPSEVLITQSIEAGAPYRSSIFYFEAGISFKF